MHTVGCKCAMSNRLACKHKNHTLNALSETHTHTHTHTSEQTSTQMSREKLQIPLLPLVVKRMQKWSAKCCPLCI